MKLNKKAILVTSSLALLFLIGGGVYQAHRLPSPVSLNTSGHPSIGEGNIQLVLFEDLTCRNCHIFTEKVFPSIEQELLNTGKARLTLIPVAFGEDSKPHANAALMVYKTAPHRFATFIQQLSHHKAKSREEILEVAILVGDIDVSLVDQSIKEQLFAEQIEKNFSLGKSLMGDEFGTPTLYVNGVMTSTESYGALKSRIVQLEGKK